MSEAACETVHLRAGRSKSGRPVDEEIRVERLSATQVRVAASPGLLLGVAAGDIIEPDHTGGFRLIERGGNLAVQLHGDTQQVDQALAAALGDLRYRFDGRAKQLTVLTIPVSETFARVEAALNRLCAQVPGSAWYYGNVYDDADGVTPLNWWLPRPA